MAVSVEGTSGTRIGYAFTPASSSTSSESGASCASATVNRVPTTRSSSSGGRPSPGDLMARSSARQHVAGGQVARGHELLAHLDQRPRSRSRSDRLTPSPSATPPRCRSRTSFCMPDRLEREGVVGALPRAVEREVLLDARARRACRRRRPSRCRCRDRRGRPRRREPLAEGLDDPQVHVLGLASDSRRALQDAELRVDRQRSAS